jgi:hypothetical protein
MHFSTSLRYEPALVAGLTKWLFDRLVNQRCRQREALCFGQFEGAGYCGLAKPMSCMGLVERDAHWEASLDKIYLLMQQISCR